MNACGLFKPLQRRRSPVSGSSNSRFACQFGGDFGLETLEVANDLRDLLGFPRHVGVAAMVVLGEPVRAVTRLRRRPVAEFARLDRWDGPAFGG